MTYSNDTANLPDFNTLLQKAITEPGILSSCYQNFHNYSIGNVFLAAVQCAEREIPFGPINTYKGWQGLGRQVQRGQKAISLCMPVTKKYEDKEGEEHAYTRFIFPRRWFVLSQTKGDDYANEITIKDWDKDKALKSLKISETRFDHGNGNVQGYAQENSIAVSPLAELPHKTRFHELAHVVLGHTKESPLSDSERTPKDIKEVEAESVAYICLQVLGLPGSTESRGYIQSWLQGGEIKEHSARRIFRTADAILKAGQTKH